MRAVETKVLVTPEGKLHIELKTDMSPGEHQVVLVINDFVPTGKLSQTTLNISGSNVLPLNKLRQG
jgi:hypothetical protein